MFSLRSFSFACKTRLPHPPHQNDLHSERVAANRQAIRPGVPVPGMSAGKLVQFAVLGILGKLKVFLDFSKRVTDWK